MWGQSTFSPACVEEAKQLCGVSDDEPESGPLSDDVFGCLGDHYDELGDTCRNRIDEKNSREDLIPQHFLEAKYYQLTKILIAISIACLAIPLLASAWAAALSRLLRKLMERVQPRSVATKPVDFANSVSPTLNGENGHDEESDNGEGGVCELSFLFLSYWVNTSAWHWGIPETPNPCCLPIVRERKQILHGVSGTLRPRQLTAVMGPSGSGKTTLLSLLGGHTRMGFMSGEFMIRGHPVPRQDYECI